MKHVWLFLIFAGLILFAGNVAAQDYSGFEAGDRELTLVGAGSSDEDFDGTNLAAELGLGYFMTDIFEIAIRQGVGYSEIEGGDDDWNGATRLALDLHLPLDPVYPYIGANIGYLYGDTIEEQFIAGPEAGIKIFANPGAFIFGAVEYEFLFEDPDEVDDNFEDGRFVYSLGIGMTF